MYSVPNEYYFRLHQIRPRFKNDVENVLLYVAESISKLTLMPQEEFASELIRLIRLFPGNIDKSVKTLQNWRTEISALFGFVEFENNNAKPGVRALELAAKQDLVEFFKYFLYSFQYPGAHTKSNYIIEQIEKGVHFKPAQYIIRTLRIAELKECKRIGLTKAEVCHCIFNDLRCTSGVETPEETWLRIKKNRDSDVEYDTRGDVIRYAGDILDYMEVANLLVSHHSPLFYLNLLENESLLKFENSTEWFSGYDDLYNNEYVTLEKVNLQYENWFSYVNRNIEQTDFSTDVLSFIETDIERENEGDQPSIIADFLKYLHTNPSVNTKDIGDMGETLVHMHECEKLRQCDREDLVHLVMRIPTQLAMGYDIKSVEPSTLQRFIEVKTTISSKPMQFNTVHLTPNEWNAANTSRSRYFVYRLSISKTEQKLFILQDPVGLYKNDMISMVPVGGADITFDVERSGQFEELLFCEH